MTTATTTMSVPRISRPPTVRESSEEVTLLALCPFALSLPPSSSRDGDEIFYLVVR
jgi:hypothetical protein